MSRIVLVEDHPRLAELVRRGLDAAGIGVDVFDSAVLAWRALSGGAYAAAVVDRVLPDGDGLELVRRLRRHGNGVPCLILTARDALRDRVDGLEAGADDYLPKPFAMEELVARVRALMRRPSTQRELQPRYLDLQVMPQDSCLRCGEQHIALATAELHILICLMRADGATVRHAALEAAAWGHSMAVTPNALEVALHRLRRKLAAVGSKLSIRNQRGLGFSLGPPHVSA